MSSNVTLKRPSAARSKRSADDELELIKSGPRSFPFKDRESPVAGSLNEHIARIEALKIRVLQWPGLGSGVRKAFFSELDALRGAFVQLANDANRTAPPRRATPAAAQRDKVDELKIGGILGQSPSIRKSLKIISKVSPTDLTVLLEGETGSGKELFARILHNNSHRDEFLAVNCGAFPTGIIESELFGHVKGAFTGATSDRKGKFEEANGGTIFLDEIGELELSAQVKLLRVLEMGELQRVGSDKAIKIDVRVVAATNRDLVEMVAHKAFREDLYYRLNMCPIYVPPLRERRDEIRILLDYFLEQICPPERKRPVLNKELADFIYYRYHFPGNIRELKNIAHYIAAIDAGRPITLNDLPDRYELAAQALEETSDSGSPLGEARDSAEKDRLVEVVSRCRGNIKMICAELNLSRARVYQLFSKHEIEPAQFR